MGGNYETTINGLRFHENAGEVHVHDDAKGLKFVTDKNTFRQDYEDMVKDMIEGIAWIEGKTKARLFIMKEGKNHLVFLAEGKNNKKALDNFVGNL